MKSFSAAMAGLLSSLLRGHLSGSSRVKIILFSYVVR